jgi:ABC-type lipoprotein release transport system permease subunit
MMITLRLAWRNLWRHPRRSLLTASAIAFVTTLLVFLITLQLGSYELMVDSSLRLFTGQMQVQRAGYLDKPQIRLVIPQAEALARALRADPVLAKTQIALRAQGFALAASRARSLGVEVVGVEPAFEPRVSTLPGLVREGRYLSGPQAREAVIGARLARNLKTEVGGELTLLGAAFDGSVAAAVVTVVGIFESGVEELDRHLVELPLGTFRETFGLEPGDAHAIVFQGPSLGALPALAAAVAAALPSGADLVVLDWRRLLPGLEQLIQADWLTGWFTYLALIVVVTASILNTFVMSVLERTREFGLLLALGATPGRIALTVMLESLLLTLLGLAAGVVLGSGVAVYFSIYGFTYPGLEQLLGQFGLPGRIYPKLSLVSIGIGPAVILAAVQIAAAYPVLRIRRLEPVAAMRAV